ncbi:hypothetical protein MSG28_010047, partial [Choristoneura fumiferana]
MLDVANWAEDRTIVSMSSILAIAKDIWAAHSIGNDGKPPEIISPFRVRVDKCQRLWVLDSGKMGSLDPNATRHTPSIIVYDLKTDNLLRRYQFPADQVKEESGFANIAIEDGDCDNTFAYAGDVGKAGIVVYSWEKNESWRITHHYFHPDPLACDFSVKGYNFSWTDAIFGIGISAPNSDNYSTIYFHPMASYNEFSVSTEFLRNKSLADANFNAFKLLGSRGPNAQSSAAFVDPKTGVLFYSLVNLNAVACWRTSNKEYTMKNQGRISMNDTTMIYPTDIKVDYNQNLWILSNRLPIWMYGKLDPADVNFRVFTAPVLDAISHTACDVTPRSDILDKFVKNVKNATAKIAAKIRPNSGASFMPMSFVSLNTLFQITACVQKLIFIPITTYTHFDFNETLMYPSLTFCRQPPYKFDKMEEYGLYSHPRFTSVWRNFNFSRTTLDELCCCHIAAWFCPGQMPHIDTKEVAVYNGGLIDYLYVNTGETIDVKLTVDQYEKISRDEDPCVSWENYSANECTTNYVSTLVGEAAGCSGPWMTSDLPRCDNYNDMRNLITTYINVYEDHNCTICPRICRAYLYNAFVTFRRSDYTWDSAQKVWALSFGDAVLETHLYLHFNTMMVSVYEERHNYDFNLFISDLGGSI